MFYPSFKTSPVFFRATLLGLLTMHWLAELGRALYWQASYDKYFKDREAVKKTVEYKEEKKEEIMDHTIIKGD